MRHVRPFGHLGQVLQLLVHHDVIADPPLQDRFVEDDGKLQVRTVEYLLAAHPDPDEPPDHAGCDRLDPAVAADDVLGVRLRLEQARHHIDVPDRDGVRLVLQADELLVVLGENVGRILPPALVGGVLGEREQQRAALAGDLVIGEQPFDLARAQSGLGPFVPADLGGRPAQRRGDRFPAPAPGLADFPQFGSEPPTAHRGAAWLGHRAPLPSGAACADGWLS